MSDTAAVSALEVTIGELFDSAGNIGTDTIDPAMLRRLGKLQQLPEPQRSAILKMIDKLAGDDPA